MATNSKFTPRKTPNLIVEGSMNKEEEADIREDSTMDTESKGESIMSYSEVEVKAAEFDVETATETPGDKKVRIRAAVNHHCTVGGVRYDLIRGETYSVPSNVRDILSRNDLLRPL